MIHLAGPVVLAATLAGAGVYGLLARRNAVLVLIGAELLLNAVNVLLVTAGSLPPGGVSSYGTGSGPSAGAGLPPGTSIDPGLLPDATANDYDALLPGQVLAIVVITIAAAEIGLALAVVLLVFRQRATSDLTALRELGESSPSYDEHPQDGELQPPAPGTGAGAGADPAPPPPRGGGPAAQRPSAGAAR